MITLEDVEVGKIVEVGKRTKYTNIIEKGKYRYLMKTDYVGEEIPFSGGKKFWIHCVSKGGQTFTLSSDTIVEMDIPWYEQVDGFRIIYFSLLEKIRKITGLGKGIGLGVKDPAYQEEYNRLKDIHPPRRS